MIDWLLCSNIFELTRTLSKRVCLMLTWGFASMKMILFLVCQYKLFTNMIRHVTGKVIMRLIDINQPIKDLNTLLRSHKVRENLFCWKSLFPWLGWWGQLSPCEQFCWIIGQRLNTGPFQTPFNYGRVEKSILHDEITIRTFTAYIEYSLFRW